MQRDWAWRDDATLLDIRRACELVAQFIEGFNEQAFLADSKTQSAVLHQILLLGEAAKRLSVAARDRFPSVPWKQISGMRDRLIHGYDSVDLIEVWNTASRDVPDLLKAVAESN